MTDLTDERLAEIRARVEATTPGDWRAVKFSSVVGCPIMTQPDKTRNSVVIAGVHGAFGDDYRAEVEANAAFIANAKADVEALLDALTSERERAERAEAERDEALRPWFGKMPTEYTVYGSGEFSVCGSGKSIADVRRWQHDAQDRLPIVLDRLTSAETRATAAEAKVAKLEGEVADLKSDVVAFCAVWAVPYAKDRGLPPGHLMPEHYDILERCGARMDDFTRATLTEKTDDA